MALLLTVQRGDYYLAFFFMKCFEREMSKNKKKWFLNDVLNVSVSALVLRTLLSTFSHTCSEKNRHKIVSKLKKQNFIKN